MPRRINFDQTAFKDYSDWSKQDRKTFEKIAELLTECARTPFEGTGKPEALKGKEYKGYWSRRINHEHRLIYKVDDEEVRVASVFGHYTK